MIVLWNIFSFSGIIQNIPVAPYIIWNKKYVKIKKNNLTFMKRHDIIQQYVMKRKQSDTLTSAHIECGSGSYCTAKHEVVSCV